MAHIVVFHSALGLRPGVRQFAEHLRAAGHEVLTPDFYGGDTYDDYQEGSQKWSAVGHLTILQQAQDLSAPLTGNVIFAGFSNGAAVAEFLAGTHPQAQAALLMHGALPLSMLHLSGWPPAVRVQLHYSQGIPFAVPSMRPHWKKR